MSEETKDCCVKAEPNREADGAMKSAVALQVVQSLAQYQPLQGTQKALFDAAVERLTAYFK